MAIVSPTPYPAPTPYMSPAYGGNVYITPGTTGVSITQDDYPIASTPNGVLWKSGKITPSTSVNLNVNSSTSPTPQPKTTTTQPSLTQPSTGGTSGGGSTGITASEALARGWDVNKLPSGYYLIQEGGGGGGVDADKIRSSIESTFNDIISSLDRQAGLLPQYEQEDVSRIEKAYGTLTSGVEQERTGAEQKLDIARQNVLANKQASLQEIEQNLRNLMRASGMTLGAMGAGSSSAMDVILPYAISKQGARAGAQVLAQANQQLAQIDQKMVDIKTVYDQEKNNIELWKTEKLQEIANTYRQWKSQIDEAKRNANAQRLAALNALDMSLLNNALAMSNWYEQQAANYSAAVDQWARDRLSQLNNYKIQLGQLSNFQPEQLVYGELKGISALPQASEGTFLNPYVLAQRRRQELGFPSV